MPGRGAEEFVAVTRIEPHGTGTLRGSNRNPTDSNGCAAFEDLSDLSDRTSVFSMATYCHINVPHHAVHFAYLKIKPIYCIIHMLHSPPEGSRPTPQNPLRPPHTRLRRNPKSISAESTPSGNQSQVPQIHQSLHIDQNQRYPLISNIRSMRRILHDHSYHS